MASVRRKAIGFAGLALGVGGLAWWLADYVAGGPADTNRLLASACLAIGFATAALTLLEKAGPKFVTLGGVVVATALALVQFPTDPRSSSESMVDRGCPQQEATATELTPADNADAARDVKFSDLHYSSAVGGNGRAIISLSGQIEGKVKPGNALYLVRTGDPTTSGRANTGAPENYFLHKRIRPYEKCWYVAPQSIGSVDECGVTVRFFMAVMSEGAVRLLEGRQNASAKFSGFDLEDLENERVALIGRFDVPTGPCPSLP